MSGRRRSSTSVQRTRFSPRWRWPHWRRRTRARAPRCCGGGITVAGLLCSLGGSAPSGPAGWRSHLALHDLFSDPGSWLAGGRVMAAQFFAGAEPPLLLGALVGCCWGSRAARRPTGRPGRACFLVPELWLAGASCLDAEAAHQAAWRRADDDWRWRDRSVLRSEGWALLSARDRKSGCAYRDAPLTSVVYREYDPKTTRRLGQRVCDRGRFLERHGSSRQSLRQTGDVAHQEADSCHTSDAPAGAGLRCLESPRGSSAVLSSGRCPLLLRHLGRLCRRPGDARCGPPDRGGRRLVSAAAARAHAADVGVLDRDPGCRVTWKVAHRDAGALPTPAEFLRRASACRWGGAPPGSIRRIVFRISRTCTV